MRVTTPKGPFSKSRDKVNSIAKHFGKRQSNIGFKMNHRHSTSSYGKELGTFQVRDSALEEKEILL